MIDILALAIALCGLMCLIGDTGISKAIDRLTDELAKQHKEKNNEKA